MATVMAGDHTSGNLPPRKAGKNRWSQATRLELNGRDKPGEFGTQFEDSSSSGLIGIRLVPGKFLKPPASDCRGLLVEQVEHFASSQLKSSDTPITSF
jgi:hypothetical protein